MTPQAPDQASSRLREMDSPFIEMPDWQQRLRDQLAAAARRRDAERDLRAQLAERRDHGLERRHAQKLGLRRGDQVSDAQGPTTESQVETPSKRATTVAATTTVATVTATDANPTPPEVDPHIPAQVTALARLRRAGAGGYRPTRPETEH